MTDAHWLAIAVVCLSITVIMRAEIERLRAENAGYQHDCRRLLEGEEHLHAEITQLRYDHAKLKAALEYIIDQGDTVCLWDAQQIARRVLEEGK